MMKHKLLLLGFCLWFISPLRAQVQGSSPLKISFIGKAFLITPGELISNVLRIHNPSSDSIIFSINTDYPYGWRQVSKSKESYTIAAGDSMFLPFRFIPSGNLTGNNRFMLSVFLVGPNNEPYVNDLFWAYTQKRTSWSMSTESGNTVYFKNGENQVRFDVSLLNTGNEKQPMLVSVNNMSLYGEVRDSANTRTLTQPVDITLNPYEDTTFHYVYRFVQGERNQTRIDIENFRPSGLNEERTFNLLVTSEEPNFGQEGAYQTGQRFIFKKLSDDARADNNSFSHLPLIVDYNVTNLFDEVTFATLNLRGVAQLDPSRQLIYNFQGSSTNNEYSQFLNNNNYYIGYFGPRGNIQVGYINGGLMGIQGFGQGIRAGYSLNKRHSLMAYYVTRKDRFNQEALQSYGMAYDIKYFKQNKARLEIGESNNKLTGAKTTAINGRININFLRTQSLNFSLSNTWTELRNNPAAASRIYGYFGMANYNGTFLKGKLAINHGFGYNTRAYANSNVERLFYNHRSRVIFNNKWSSTLVNNYNQSSTFLLSNAEVTSLTNQFMVNRSFKNKSLQPYVFVNFYRQNIVTYEMRGLGINYNQFNPKTNTRFSTTIEGGSNKPTYTPGLPSTSFLQWTTLAFYKTLTLNTRYLVGIYGYSGQSATQVNTSNQQLFTSSLQHQYLFANKKLMLQTGINYSYNNIFKQHNLTLFPDLYYFTADGWRFRLGINYNILSGIALRNAYSTQQAVADEEARTTTQNTFISVGVRKEFALPIPFKKSKFFDVQYTAFFDVNGNGIKDKSEKTVENVVIKMGDEEVITNENGEANLRNVASRLYHISAFSLDNINGWFANIEDTLMIMKPSSVMIPFVRGVRVKGKISIDRDAVNADASEPFDLGRIRVSASGNKSFSALTDFNGYFELYLPYGKYIITVDENILGTKYRLARNNYEIDATKESDGMVISFLIIEKRRKVVKKVFAQPADTTQQQVVPPARNRRTPAGRTTTPRRQTNTNRTAPAQRNTGNRAPANTNQRGR
jgi:hypothetical protein